MLKMFSALFKFYMDAPFYLFFLWLVCVWGRGGGVQLHKKILSSKSRGKHHAQQANGQAAAEAKGKKRFLYKHKSDKI